MPDTKPIAALNDVTVRYGGADPALNGVNLTVERGEILGIVGESGAGKSTLLRLLDIMENPTAGVIRIEGIDPSGLSGRKRRLLRRRIGMVFQHFNLLSNRTVAQNVAIALRVQGRRDPAAVAQMLDFVSLAHRAGQYPAQLSGGEKQRVAIARALVAEPSLLLCDEPTSALDDGTSTEILGLLSKTRRDLGTTVVLVTHELAAVKEVCDRAAVLSRGILQEVIPVTRPSSPRGSAQSYLEHVRGVLES